MLANPTIIVRDAMPDLTNPTRTYTRTTYAVDTPSDRRRVYLRLRSISPHAIHPFAWPLVRGNGYRTL